MAVFLNIPRTGAGRGGLGGLAPPGVEKIFLKKSSKSAKNRIGLSKKSLFFNFFPFKNRYFSSISVKSRPCYSMSVILTDIVFFHSSNSKITIISHFPEISRGRVYIACHDVIDPTFIFFHQNRYFSSISIKSRAGFLNPGRVILACATTDIVFFHSSNSKITIISHFPASYTTVTLSLLCYIAITMILVSMGSLLERW